MPAPSRLSFEVDDSGRAAGLVAWRGEAIGTIVTELAPTIGGSKVRAYGSLELRGSDGSTGRVRLDREGLLVPRVSRPLCRQGEVEDEGPVIGEAGLDPIDR